MPTPTSDTLFQGDHRGNANPADPNLFSLADMAAAMGTDSLAISTTTSKVISTAAASALDSAPVSTASSKATSAAAQASIADSKAVSTSVPTSVADSKAISVSRNTSVADSKAVSLDTALIIPAVGTLPGFQQPVSGAVVRTANAKMAELYSVKDFGANLGAGLLDDSTAFTNAAATIGTAALMVPAGTYRIASNLSLSCPLVFALGAVLKPDSGKTITINGAIDAAPRRIFDTSGGGLVAFARGVAPIIWGEWFGAGTLTDDAAAVNSAITAAFQYGGTVGQCSQWTVRSPINLTNAASGTNYGLTIRNYGRATANGATASPSISAAHTGHVFDCAGTANIIFEDISIVGDVTSKPATGWFFARNTAGSDGGGHRLRNCRTSGYFTVAPIYGYGSELNEYTECWIWNQNDDTPALIITGQNVRTQSSTFITVATAPQSNITHNINGGSWWCGRAVSAGSTIPGADAIYLESASAVKITKSWIASGDGVATGGRSLITVDGTHTTSDHLTVRDVTGELLAVLPTYGIRVANGTGTHAHWDIRQNRFPAATRAFYGDDGQTFDALDISQLNEASALGVDVKNLQNSSFRGANTLIAIRGTSSQNILVGRVANFTVATRSVTDIWLDLEEGGLAYDGLTSSALGLSRTSRTLRDVNMGTFTPAMAIGAGAPSAYAVDGQVGTYTKLDNRVHFSMRVTLATLGAATGTVTFTGLPFTAANTNGESHPLVVEPLGVNLTSGQHIAGYVAPNTATVFLQVRGSGSPISNANLTESQLTSGADFMVSGSYRV